MTPSALPRFAVVVTVLVATVAFARSSGSPGYSGLQGAYCSSCHAATGSAPTVTITGPSTLTVGATGNYTLTITGGPANQSGLDVATTAGTLGTSAANEKLVNGELVQSSPQAFTSGTSSWPFTLTAPATTGTVILYASGLSGSGSGAGGDYAVAITFSVTVTASSQPPTIATAAAASPGTVAGTMTALSVLGADDNGESALTYTWTATGPASVSFSPNGTNAAKNTTATFTAAGSYTFTATVTDAQGGTATSSVSVVVQQTITAIAVSPATANVANGGTQQFNASATDQFGAAAATTFTWSASAGGTISSSGLFTATTSGGPYTITASSSGQSGTASATVFTPNGAPTIATAAAASPSTVSGNSTALSVLGADDNGEPALVYTWSATGPATVSFSASGTNAAKNATATFSKAGAYTLTATVRDAQSATATSSVNVTVQQTVTSASVTPATATISNGATAQFTASAVDQFGNVMTPPFSWTVSGGGTISTSGLFTATTVGGPYTVTATSGSTSATAQVTVNNQAPTIATAASASPGTVSGTTTNLSVLGADDSGEANLSYTWAATTAPAPVTFSSNGSNAAKATTATFTRAGAYVFSVTARDAQGLTATSSVNVNVSQTLTTITVTPGSASIATNTTKQFSAAAVDQFGDPKTASFTWSVSGGGTISSAGLFTAGSTTGGPYTVTASASGKSGTASLTLVAPPPPTVANAAAASPATVTATTTSLTVLGADNGGESSLTYTWSASGPASVTFSPNGTNAAKNATATFSRAGSYSLTATITNAYGLTVTSAVSVVVQQTLTSISVSPASATVINGDTLQLSASASDQFGSSMTVAFTWTASGGGSISSNGLFSSTTLGGPFTITASSGSKSGTASITVNANQAPTITTAAKAYPSPVTGTTTTLSVSATDDGGGSALTYTWVANGAPAAVTFSANGTNAAKSTVVTFQTTGSYSFTVTVRDAAGLTATDQVSVTVNQKVTTVTVSPANATINPLAVQAFLAAATDQFGAPMSPTFNWSASGGGTITQAGVFTADNAAGGPYSVTATSGSKSASASVTVSGQTAPTIATAATVSPATVTGRTAKLSVRGADSQGEATLRYSWSSSGPAPVSFSVNDSNAAKDTQVTFTRAGSYALVATVTNANGITATSTATATVVPTSMSLSLSPIDVVIGAGEKRTFTAAAIDQFWMPIEPSVSWTASGGGSIDALGNFTADTGANGAFVVTASSGSLTASTGVTVIPTPSAGDLVSPDCSWISPSANAELTGTVTLEASASDDVGVREVRFLVDNLLLGVATTEPYAIPLDTTSLPVGNHVLSAIARDLAGNEGSAGQISVRITRPPEPDSASSHAGCSAAGGSSFALLSLLALLSRRKRRTM